MSPNFPYKNGLTKKQVDAVKIIFSKVNLKAICDRENISLTTIYNVLRDSSKRIDLLKKAVDLANIEIATYEEVLASILTDL